MAEDPKQKIRDILGGDVPLGALVLVAVLGVGGPNGIALLRQPDPAIGKSVDALTKLVKELTTNASARPDAYTRTMANKERAEVEESITDLEIRLGQLERDTHSWDLKYAKDIEREREKRSDTDGLLEKRIAEMTANQIRSWTAIREHIKESAHQGAGYRIERLEDVVRDIKEDHKHYIPEKR